jgi:menaquinone-dependent protoporphyrinogen IX oxidase
MNHSALIYYHTATGNTGWVTGEIARQLREKGCAVMLRNIAHQRDAADTARYDLIGFGCPVMGFRPTFSMTDFIDKLPLQQKKAAFVYNVRRHKREQPVDTVAAARRKRLRGTGGRAIPGRSKLAAGARNRHYPGQGTARCAG